MLLKAIHGKLLSQTRTPHCFDFNNFQSRQDNSSIKLACMQPAVQGHEIRNSARAKESWLQASKSRPNHSSVLLMKLLLIQNANKICLVHGKAIIRPY